MCGIAGFIDLQGGPARRDVIEAMTAALSHRGPDGFGVVTRSHVALGHRRLAIIDPTGGKQPMSNEDGQVWITYNGEIYNYRELRSELESKGHQFRTHSDTETVVHAYEEWGDRCVERFRGMFAFGIIDWREGRLFLARDHFGIKPLYYLQKGHLFAFASEIQALKQIPDIDLKLDPGAVDQFLWLQYIPAPRTAFGGISKLPPAHCMTVSLDGSTRGPREYWNLDFVPDHNRSEAEWIEDLDAVLKESVQAHLVSDVPFGAFLSGGVDSSLVVAYMAQLLGRPVHTFSIGFDEPEFNEIAFSSFASKQWGTDHATEIVKPDALAVLPKLVRHYGDLFGDSSALPTYFVSQLARRNVPMVLSGDGADEMFAGYWSHGDWMSSFVQDNTITPTLDHWLKFINYLPTPLRQALWRPEYRHLCPTPLDYFEHEFGRAAKMSPCSKVQYMDVKTYLPFAILTKVDIASMAHGLEVRTPFVDTRVAEFAAQIPEQFNIARNAGGGFDRKLLLKKVATKYYPAEFINRPKMGFAIPIAKWFAPGGQLHQALRSRLIEPGSLVHEYFEPSVINDMIGNGLNPQLWLLLVFEEWLRQNTGGAVASKSNDHEQTVLQQTVSPQPAPQQTAPQQTVNRQTVAQQTVAQQTMPREDPIGPAGIVDPPQAPAASIRVLILYDVEGWAWWYRAQQIKRHLPPDIAADLVRIDQPLDHDGYRFVMIFDPYLISLLARVPAEKIIVGCSCPEYLQQTVELLSSGRCAAGVVNNRSMYLDGSRLVPNLFCCQNGVDDILFQPAHSESRGQIACWVGNSGSVGRKGLDLITEACRRADIRLIALDRDAYRDKGSLLSQEQVRDAVYHQATFYICASAQEGTPNPALEALACGLPVISTRVGNMPEIIRDGYNGFLVDQSVESIVEAIGKLSALQPRDLALNARQSVLDGWTWRQQAEKYLRMFRILSHRGSSSRAVGRRIAVVAHYYHESGGTETLAQNIADGVRECGNQVEIVFLSIQPLNDDATTQGTSNESAARFVAHADYAALVTTMDEVSPDTVLLLTDVFDNALDYFAELKFAPIFNKIVYLNINNQAFSYLESNPDFAKSRSLILKRYDVVVTMFEESFAASFFRSYGVPYEIIGTGIPETPTGPHSFKRDHGIPADSHMLIYPALVAPLKNQLALFEIAGQIHADVTIVFLGDLYLPIPQYLEEFRSKLTGSGNCIYLSGLCRGEVAQAMAEASLCLFPSLSEGAPLTLVEAMSHGLPWICSPEVVFARQLRGGIVAELSQFPAQIDDLLGNPALRETLGKEGKDCFEENFKIGRTVEQFDALIARLPAPPRKRLPVTVIDGVFFQMNDTGIARVWKELLCRWAGTEFGQSIVVLDRIGTAPRIPGLRYRLVPAYDHAPQGWDRTMLQQVCAEERADLFISTYYTTPVTTPSLFLAYDMIPEFTDFYDLSDPQWQEKHRAISQASAFVAISRSTAMDLAKLYPELSERVVVAHCGVNRDLFAPASDGEIQRFRERHGLAKPFFLFVGGRNGYKNGRLLVQAFTRLSDHGSHTLLFAGGQPTLEPHLKEMAGKADIRVANLSDQELRVAYSGALALVYPSRYEGFGLPILEAMGCGCPVITCQNSSLPEVAGAAALYVEPDDPEQLAEAMRQVQRPAVRKQLIRMGSRQSAKFSWDDMARTIEEVIRGGVSVSPSNLPRSAAHV